MPEQASLHSLLDPDLSPQQQRQIIFERYVETQRSLGDDPETHMTKLFQIPQRPEDIDDTLVQAYIELEQYFLVSALVHQEKNEIFSHPINEDDFPPDQATTIELVYGFDGPADRLLRQWEHRIDRIIPGQLDRHRSLLEIIYWIGNGTWGSIITPITPERAPGSLITWRLFTEGKFESPRDIDDRNLARLKSLEPPE